MADSKSSGSGFGALGLTGFIGSLVAWCKTPTFVGWAGAGKSLLVGAGTSMGASIVAIPAAIGGAIIGGLTMLLTGSKKAAIVGAIGGAVVCGIGGGVYGAVQGYNFSHDALTEGCKTSFNQAAPKAQAAAQPAAYAKLSANDYNVRPVARLAA